MFIREAAQSDLPAIERLLEELIAAMVNAQGIDPATVAGNCRDSLIDGSSHMLVADAGGTLVGFINFATRQAILHRSPSGLVDELVVAESYRGRGIGRQLVLAAVERCRGLGCCELEVSTEKTNTRAREFYRKCGLEERGVLLELDLQSM
ncbi:MAG: GNAT family N-acetyltransferase [Dehalococcoidia bacterium]|nr:GNAT family N-acetyltransferase [Dehalococcoidia bacterium]